MKSQMQTELMRLRKEQQKSRQDEVFVGLSQADRTAYDQKAERIHELEKEIPASAVPEQSYDSARTEQRGEWNKAAETDIPQDEAHQPYRSREKDSADASTPSTKKRTKRNNQPDEKGRE